MRNILNILVILCLFISCNNQEIKISDYQHGNLIIKNGEKLIQGEEYDVILNTAGLAGNEFYVDIYYNLEKDNKFKYKTIPLKKIDEKIYKGRIKILPNTSWIYLHFSGPKQNLDCSYSFQLPVYKNENEFEYAACSAILKNAKKNTYLKYFYLERMLYPDNIAIFATRWSYETKNDLINNDSVEAQIKFLEKHYPSHQALPLLKLIAYSYLQDIDGIMLSCSEIIKNVRYTNALSNWELSGFLSNTLNSNYEKFPSMINKILEVLLDNNPQSHFTKSMIMSGFLKRKENFNQKIILNAINKLAEEQNQKPTLLIQKGITLSKYFLPDSSKEVAEIIEHLIKIYRDYSLTNSLYREGNDSFHAFFMGAGLIQSIIYEWAIKTKEYQKGIDYLKLNLDNFEINNINKGVSYQQISDLFDLSNQKDSALKYLTFNYSFFLVPSKDYLLNKFKKILNIRDENQLSKNILELQNKYKLSKLYLSKNFPLIKFIDGTSLDILDINTPKFFIFFNLQCSPCKDLFNDILRQIQYLKNYKFTFVLISPDKTEKLKKFSIYDSLETKIVSNFDDIVKYFNVGYSAPQFILVREDNSIVGKFFGYKKGSLNWEDIILLTISETSKL